LLTKTPWRPTKQKQRIGWRLGKKQRADLITTTADLMRAAQPTAFALEAPRRHRLRERLCLQGWPWIIADAQAEEITRVALHRIGARRPRWIEGQREYCNANLLRDEYCWRCGSPLPPYAKRYCSPVCVRIVAYQRSLYWRQREIPHVI